MKLKQYYEIIIEKDSIQKKLMELESQKNQTNKLIRVYEDKYRKEKDDVDQLENAGLKSFFLELLGNKEEMLEKERKEAYEVKLKLDSYKILYNSIFEEIERYEYKLRNIVNSEQDYQKLYNEKKNLLSNEIEIIDLENKISDSNHQIKEINEAIYETQKSLNLCEKVISDLESSDFWATYDAVSRGGLISYHMKYSKLDQAQNNVNELQAQLKRLKTELVDINLTEDIKISIDEFDRALDFWFDNIFTDFKVRDKIRESLDQSRNTNSRLKTIFNKLNNMLEEQTNIKNNLQAELDKIIVYK